jgi:Transposase DDE domain
MSAVPFKANADRRHHIPKQQDRVTNWSEYDAALRQRGSLTVWFTEEAIAAWRAEPRTTRGGQPHYSALAITTALTLRAVFRLALRQTEGLIGSVIRLLGLDLAIPDHSTLSRRAETLAVAGPPSSAEPVHLLVDSTGLKLSGAGEWLVEKHGTSRRRSWRKLHIGVDADTGRIVASPKAPGGRHNALVERASRRGDRLVRSKNWKRSRGHPGSVCMRSRQRRNHRPL